MNKAELKVISGSAKEGTLLAHKEWLTREDVAMLLGVSVSFVDRNLRTILPTYRLATGSRVHVYKRIELNEHLEKNKFDPDVLL